MGSVRSSIVTPKRADDDADFSLFKQWRAPIATNNNNNHTGKVMTTTAITTPLHLRHEESQIVPPLHQLHNGSHRPFTLPHKKGEEAQNCVKFETHRSNYLVELIEGILPKEIINGSKILVKITEPSHPNIIYVNFSTAVRAYQAQEFMTYWNEYTPTSNRIKSTLIKKSLDPLYSINSVQIDSFPEYPIPRSITVISNEEQAKKTNELLLYGLRPADINFANNIQLGITYEWHHKEVNSDEPNFYVVTVCNHDHCVVYNLNELKKVPQQLIDILESKSIGKVGYNHRMETLKFEKQYGIKLNNFEDLSKTPIVMRSKPKTIRAITGLFLRQKLGRNDINRYATPQSLMSEKRIHHYAQQTDCIRSLFYVLESDKVDFKLQYEEGDHIDYIEDD
ncbi:hypothetical protein SAMD00019534_060280 [Acytostelium subglobosum LB1]|uniref:hypothetical protein n=1 Tax=Acytostelium subglobosum LB1 TaxID=1410327 RepID=UPI000644BC45|nr:hypothetical protein SAMD00019534_060280 [Acytostelium subglobosum LB1]GAM22853.1 hypothetical protein SAMD00019534_060280 [Acytostelium subglobosum LB1]|eukprot:XP_012754080.1 hypothetical protein SAMD00019534_060280 [Acytostelium subglobosum LB1]